MNTYHYTICGLDYIYLVNGFTVDKVGEEEYVSVDDITGLHKAIANHIVRNKPVLDAQDFRFLRKEFNLSQVTLGKTFGVSESAIRDYESGRRPVPPAVDRLIRAFYLNSDVRELIEKISELDQEVQEEQFLLHHEEESGWQKAA